MSLADKLRGRVSERRQGPLWDGPCSASPNGGITFSLLSRFLGCRERFRALVVEGYKSKERFNHRMEYGNMWHACEEGFAERGDMEIDGEVFGGSTANSMLEDYCRHLCRKYPLQQQEVDKWYNVCKVQFPLYVDYWSRHPDMEGRRPLLQEHEFKVPYRLPSGRTVQLRGKWDSVDQVTTTCSNCQGKKVFVEGGRAGTCATCNGTGSVTRIWLQENKTKGDIDEQQMRRQLRFDLQTMMYLVALKQFYEWDEEAEFPANVPLAGVRYNVIRRPLSGGAGSIVQHKETRGAKCPKCKGKLVTDIKAFGEERTVRCPKCKGVGRINAKPAETKEEYYGRLKEIIEADAASYFMRWHVFINDCDLSRFRERCLDPLLEHLCDWYDQVVDEVGLPTSNMDGTPYATPLTWQHPYGVRNVLDEGGSTDLDEYLETGSTVGLHRVERLFSELSYPTKGA